MDNGAIHNVTPKQSCGALIYSKATNRYLFLLRNGSRYAGSWALPGGKVEEGERVVEALYREMREELRADLRYNKIVPLETFTSDNYSFIYYTYLIPVEDEFAPILNEEHCGYCWVPLSAHPRPLHPGVWRTFKFKVVVDKIATLEKLLQVI